MGAGQLAEIQKVKNLECCILDAQTFRGSKINLNPPLDPLFVRPWLFALRFSPKVEHCGCERTLK